MAVDGGEIGFGVLFKLFQSHEGRAAEEEALRPALQTSGEGELAAASEPKEPMENHDHDDNDDATGGKEAGDAKEVKEVKEAMEAKEEKEATEATDAKTSSETKASEAASEPIEPQEPVEAPPAAHALGKQRISKKPIINTVVAIRRVDPAKEDIRGYYKCKEKGCLEFGFDNSFSYFRTKSVELTLSVLDA